MPIPEIFTIEGSVGKLHAELQKPANDKKKIPLVIICHGFTGNGNTELLKDIADDLQSQGIASLRFDFNGHGQSEGEFQNMTVLNEIEDLKNVVLMAPAAVLRDDALRGNTQGAQYDPWNFKGDYVELPGRGLKLGRKYVETAVNLPIYETAWRYTGPVLVIQGSHDRIVPYTYAERYVQGYKDATLKIIPDEDHSFTKDTAEAALYASDWLTKQIKGVIQSHS